MEQSAREGPVSAWVREGRAESNEGCVCLQNPLLPRVIQELKAVPFYQAYVLFFFYKLFPVYRIIIWFQYALQCTQSLASICHHKGDPMYPFSCPPPLPCGDHFPALGISLLIFVGFAHIFVCVFVLHLHLGSTPFFMMVEVSANHSWLLIIGFFNRLFLVPEQFLSQGPLELEWGSHSL